MSLVVAIHEELNSEKQINCGFASTQNYRFQHANIYTARVERSLTRCNNPPPQKKKTPSTCHVYKMTLHIHPFKKLQPLQAGERANTPPFTQKCYDYAALKR